MSLKPTDSTNTHPLDLATDAIAGEPLDPQLVASAAARVWERLQSSAQPAGAGAVEPTGTMTIGGCAGFQALMPAYLSNALDPAHRLLVEHHSRECVACRRALGRLRHGPSVASSPQGTSAAARHPWERWALAAGLGAVLLTGFAVWRLTVPGTTEVQVRSIAGELQRVGGNNESLAAGQRFRSGEVVRTATGSRAVLTLEDGSQVEMAERSEVKLERRRSGLIVDLVRGGVIVEASKQPASSRLFVRTGDCTVAVAGTIFSVSHGAKGSRISVIEGEVDVEGGVAPARRGSSGGRRLRPGEQWMTRADLVSVPLEREIAWSHNAASYRHRLEALHALGRELDQALTVPGRTSTRLLDAMPPDTVVYLAAPNVSDSLGNAWDRLQDRLDDDPELRAWWDQHFGADPDRDGATIDAYLDELRAFGAELGPEIAVSVGAGTMRADAGDPTGEPGPPVLAAEVPRPASFSATLDAEIERLNARAGEHLAIRRVSAPTAASRPDELLVWLHDDVLLASPDGTRLSAVAAALGAGGRSAFAGTPFHAKIAAIYEAGAGWVAAVDVASLVSAEAAAAEGRLGLADLDSVVFNSRGNETEGGSQHAATFAFSSERRGVASWLAAPAPVGALDFVSPEASFAAAGVFKDPDEMLADALALAASQDGSSLRDIENERLIALRQDLASALGSDIAVAIDGPWLPQPSWKLAVEVYDRHRLQAAIEELVREWNRSGEGHSAVLSEEEVNGRVVYRLDRTGGQAPGGPIHYLYEDGYLVAGPNRALLLEAVTQRAAGISLGNSSKFTALLPRDREMHFSAVVYQDLGGAGAALGDWLAQNQNVAPDDRAAMQAMMSSGGPGLVVAYGGSDRVEIVGRSEEGLLGLSFRRLIDIAGMARRSADAEPEAAPARRRTVA